MPSPPHPGTGPSDHSLGRRELLRAMASGAGLTAAAVHLSSPTAQAASFPTTWNIEAVSGNYVFANGASLTYYRYQAVGGGATRGLLPFLQAIEGTQVTVNIDNRLPLQILPAVVGLPTFLKIPANTSASFTFTMPPAGSYLFSHADRPQCTPGPTRPFGEKAHPMVGLSALMVSRPASIARVLYDGGPSFDREFVLLYEDTDSRWNAVMAGGLGGPLEPYHPDYFTLNGLAFPDTMAYPDTLPSGKLGERILLRLGNLGCMRQSIHVHGFHVEIAARNNIPETILPPKDTVPVAAGTTTDVILEANQLGQYPLHPHSLTATTANGLYPLGQLTLINII